jgi:hypothetical protein
VYLLTRTGFEALRGDRPELKETLTPAQVTVLKGLSYYRRGASLSEVITEIGEDIQDEELRDEVEDILESLVEDGLVKTPRRGVSKERPPGILEYPEHKVSPLSISYYHMAHGDKRRYLPVRSSVPLPTWEPEDFPEEGENGH